MEGGVPPAGREPSDCVLLVQRSSVSGTCNISLWKQGQQNAVFERSLTGKRFHRKCPKACQAKNIRTRIPSSFMMHSSAPFCVTVGSDGQIVLDVQLVVELHDISMLSNRNLALLKFTFCWWCVCRCVHRRFSARDRYRCEMLNTGRQGRLEIAEVLARTIYETLLNRAAYAC